MTVLAVLLIIGSAVVGPIEAQPITDPAKMAVYDACIKRLGPSGDVAENNRRSYRCSDEAEKPVHYESLPELCERAMKESGLRLVISGVGADGKVIPSGGPWTSNRTGISRPSGTAYYVLLDTTELAFNDVHCVAVPTGYKR